MNWEPASILADGPLKSMRIGGVDYPVGRLSAEWLDQYENEHFWTVEHHPHRADQWLAIRGLLEAGNENLNWAEIAPHLTIELILPAAREVCRQAILMKLNLYADLGILNERGVNLFGSEYENFRGHDGPRSMERRGPSSHPAAPQTFRKD